MARRALALALVIPLACGCGWLPLFTRHSAEESARLTDQARQACERGDQMQARELLSRAAAVAPDDPEIQRDIGRGLLLAGETKEAIKHLRYMMRRGVDDPDAYLDLARILFNEHRYAECEELVDSALRLVPAHVEAQLLKGQLAEVGNKDDQALAIYYRLLAADPTATEATLRISELLLRGGRGSQAAPLLAAITDSDHTTKDEQGRAHWLLGQVYAKEHRWPEATEQLAASAALRKAISADECYQIAYAAWEAGQRGKSHEYLWKALALEPGHTDALALAALSRHTESTAQTAYSPPPLPAPKGWEETESESIGIR
jgi:tetratricopeptide (TPR) repeat protein